MSRRPPQLRTVGYAELTPDSLVALLRQHGVDLLADVRESARSRRPGFSKTVLARAVQAAGIEYRQFRDLGVPKPGRDAYHASGDFDAFASAYQRRLDALPEALEELAELSRGRRVCLLCLEADAARCHRSLLAGRVAALTGAAVEHLRAPQAAGAT